MYKRYKKRIITAGIVISMLAIVTACFVVARRYQPEIVHEKMSIVCTTSILADAVKQVAGQHAQVTCLMLPGVDPHLYRAKAHDAYAIAQADMIFYHGLHLEGKMTELLSKLRRHKPCVAVGQLLDADDLISSDQTDVYDPHIWHDVVLWKNVVEQIYKQLASFDPTHKQEYRTNTDSYQAELDSLDEAMRQKIATLPEQDRILITAHDAFSYFGKRYGFKIITLQGISTETEINTKDIENVVTSIVQHHVRAIFVESSIAPGSIHALREAVEARNHQIACGKELFSDSLGDETTEADTYTHMMLHNCSAIVEGLQPHPIQIHVTSTDNEPPSDTCD